MWAGQPTGPGGAGRTVRQSGPVSDVCVRVRVYVKVCVYATWLQKHTPHQHTKAQDQWNFFNFFSFASVSDLLLIGNRQINYY